MTPRPTLAELRAESDLIEARLPASTENDVKLAVRAESAAALVASLTFRLIDPVVESTIEGYVFEEVPGSLLAVMRRAIALMVERLLVTGAPKFAEQVATGRRLRGFTAGPYSESYFAPGEFSRRGAQGRPPMDADDALDAALWALATEDARVYFIFQSTGKAPPGAAVQSFNWTGQGRGRVRGDRGIGDFGRGPY